MIARRSLVSALATLACAGSALAHAGRPAEATLNTPAIACSVVDRSIRVRWVDYDDVTPFGDSEVEILTSTGSFPPPFLGERPTAPATLIHRVAESDLSNAFTWDTSTVASGHYLVWTWVNEPPAEPAPLSQMHEAPNWVTVLHPGDTLYGPLVQVVEPASRLDSVSEALPRYEIAYTVCVPDSAGAVVRLEAAYRGRTFELIADNLPAVADGRFTWNVDGLLPGPWIIRASIRDACGRTFTNYARYPLNVATALDLDAGARDVSLSAPLESTLDPDASCGTSWSAPDAGVGAPDADAGVSPDAVTTVRADAMGMVPPTEEGCGCASTAPTSPSPSIVLLLVLALALRRARYGGSMT